MTSENSGVDCLEIQPDVKGCIPELTDDEANESNIDFNIKKAKELMSTEQEGKKASKQHPLLTDQNVWTPVEIALLEEAIHKYGTENWHQVANYVNSHSKSEFSKSQNQCNERWNRVQNPDVRKGKWTKAEDELLIAALLNCPPKKWKQISEQMDGRTDVQCRYRLNKLRAVLIERGIKEEYFP